MPRWILASCLVWLSAIACSPPTNMNVSGAEMCASPVALEHLRSALLTALTQQHSDFEREISIAAVAVMEIRDVRVAQDYPSDEAARCLADLVIAGGNAKPLTYVTSADGVSLATEYAVLRSDSDEGRFILNRAAQSAPALAARLGEPAENAQSDPHFAPHIQALIERERDFNSICRDSSPQSEAACEQRNALSEELYGLGMCYGRQGEFGYQASWHRCTPVSCRPDGCERSEESAPSDVASEPLAAARPLASLDAPAREERGEMPRPVAASPATYPSPDDGHR